MSRSITIVAVLYVGALALAVGYGAFAFGEFYNPPSFHKSMAPPPADEDTLLAAYDRALAGDFGRYRTFTRGAGVTLAVGLGLAAALVGRWRRSLLYGAGAFVAGGLVTVAAFELLPSIWFPFDSYAAGFIWALSCGPVAAGAWLLATAAGRLQGGPFGGPQRTALP